MRAVLELLPQSPVRALAAWPAALAPTTPADLTARIALALAVLAVVFAAARIDRRWLARPPARADGPVAAAVLGALERIAATGTLALIAILLTTSVLAALGAARPGTVAAALVAIAAGMVLSARSRVRGSPRDTPTAGPSQAGSAEARTGGRAHALAGVLLAVLVAGGVGLRCPPMVHALAGRDQGTYLLRAWDLAARGQVHAIDPRLADAAARAASPVPDAAEPPLASHADALARAAATDVLHLYPVDGTPARRGVYDGPERPGRYLADRERGLLVPQFLHGRPAVSASATWLLGPERTPWTLPIEGALALCAVAAAAWRAFSPLAAIAAVGWLALDPLMIWTGRQTLTEPLVLALLAGALLWIVRARAGGSPANLDAAALAIASAAWVRGNLWLLGPIGLFVIACAGPVGAPPGARHRRALAIAACTMGASVAIHGATVFPYLHDEVRRLRPALTPSPWGLTVAVIAAIVVAPLAGLLAARIGARMPRAAGSRRRAWAWTGPLAAGVTASVIAAWAIGLAMRGTTPPFARLDPAPVLLAWSWAAFAALGLVRASFWTLAPAPAQRESLDPRAHLHGSDAASARESADAWAWGLAAWIVTTAAWHAIPTLPQAHLYYYGRYLVPELWPALAWLGAAGVHAIAGEHNRAAPRDAAAQDGAARGRDALAPPRPAPWRRRAAALAVAASLAHVGWPLVAQPTTRIDEFAETAAAIAWLDQWIPDDAVIIAGGEGWHGGHAFNQVGGALAIGLGRTVWPERGREGLYATLSALLLPPPGASSAGAASDQGPPRVVLLRAESTHPVGDEHEVLAGADDLLPPPFVARRVALLELATHRLTPVVDVRPARVTRELLRIVAIEVTLDAAAAGARWAIDRGVADGPQGLVIEGLDAAGCLVPEQPARLRLDERARRLPSAAIAVVVDADHAAPPVRPELRLDGEIRGGSPPFANRTTSTLGPWWRRAPTAGAHVGAGVDELPQDATHRRFAGPGVEPWPTIELHARGAAVAGARCPYGEPLELRLLGLPAPALRSSAPIFAVQAPPARDLGHPLPRLRWSSAASWSARRPDARISGTQARTSDGDAAAAAGPASVSTATVGDAIRMTESTSVVSFAPEPLPARGREPLNWVVHLRDVAVGASARIVLEADGVEVARWDPPDQHPGTWASPAIRWRPRAPIARLRLRAIDLSPTDSVSLRDVAAFDDGWSIPARVQHPLLAPPRPDAPSGARAVADPSRP